MNKNNFIIIFLIFTLIMIVVLSSFKKTNENFYNNCGGTCEINADCSSNFICLNNKCCQV